MFTAAQAARFWSWVDRKGPDECWPWIGSFRKDGRGQVKIAGKVRKAHQVSYELVKGERDPSLEIRHTCNNKACQNPAHLVQGTHTENMDDYARTGQAAKKITPAAVREIIAAAQRRESFRSIGRRFGITHRSVSLIVCGVWHHRAQQERAA